MKRRQFAPHIPLPDFRRISENVAADTSPGLDEAVENGPTVIQDGVEQQPLSPAPVQAHEEGEKGSQAITGQERAVEPREYVAPKADDLGTLEEIPLDKILASPFQPRLFFDEQALEDLAENIREVGGLVEPIKVRPLADGRYELISGERRVRAYRLNGESTIPAWIKAIDDDAAFKEACAENLNREDLTLFEKATAYKRALDEGRAKSERALAVLSGANRMDVNRCLKLFKLPPEAIQVVKSNSSVLALSHIERLVGLSEDGYGELVTSGLALVSKGRLKREMLIPWIEKQIKPRSQIQTFHQYSLNGKPLGRLVIKNKKLSFNLDSEENSKLLVEAFEKAIASLGATRG